MDAFTSTSTAFNFLRLPKELRLMIYERIPKTVKHHTFSHHETLRFTLVSHHFPTAILRTCRLLNAEAKPLFQHAADSRPRFLIPPTRNSTMDVLNFIDALCRSTFSIIKLIDFYSHHYNVGGHFHKSSTKAQLKHLYQRFRPILRDGESPEITILPGLVDDGFFALFARVSGIFQRCRQAWRFEVRVRLSPELAKSMPKKMVADAELMNGITLDSEGPSIFCHELTMMEWERDWVAS